MYDDYDSDEFRTNWNHAMHHAQKLGTPSVELEEMYQIWVASNSISIPFAVVNHQNCPDWVKADWFSRVKLG
jgi:hypothetical protein